MALGKKDIAGLRQEYKLGQLDEGELLADPLEQFRRWFNDALDCGVMEPNAMVLATASADGQPASRVVLLKDIDPYGLCFYTNYESRKGLELLHNPCAALLFFWPELQRQVRVEGIAERLPEEAADAYFQSRPKGSRLGALASHQSREIACRNVLDDQLAKLEEAYAGTEDVPRPAYWGGYRVRPQRFEFWQGRSNRLHDRLVYKKEVSTWIVIRLAP